MEQHELENSISQKMDADLAAAALLQYAEALGTPAGQIREAAAENPQYQAAPKSRRRFHKALHHRLRREKRERSSCRSFFYRNRTWIAIAAAVLLLSIVATAFKEPIFDFFASVREDEVSIANTRGGQSANAWTREFYPSYLPEGFTQSGCNSRGNVPWIAFQDENGRMFTLLLYFEENNIGVSNSAAIRSEVVSVNGCTGILTTDGATLNLTWGGNPVLHLCGNITRDELLSIAENIILSDAG